MAGLAIEKLGEDVCFSLNALSFIAVILSLVMMRLPVYTATVHTKNILGELREGFAYIKGNPSIAFIIIMLGLVSLFVFPYATLMPVYARDIFHGSASTFGVIDSAIGLGAFAGAIFLASLPPGSNLSKILAINTFVFGIGLMLFAYTTIYPLALLFATIGAFGMMSQITITNTLIQTSVSPAMRGRVISFYAMAFFGMQPIGGLVVGFISEHAGVQATVLGEGVIAILIGFLHLRFVRKNKLRQTAAPVPVKQAVEPALQA